jgi:hypothetical protein
VTQDSRRIPPAPCPGDPHNCELLLRSQEAYHGRGAQAEISGHEAVVSAMAVGLVVDVWRNGPVEDMHCGKRGPDDAAMFAAGPQTGSLQASVSLSAPSSWPNHSA